MIYVPLQPNYARKNKSVYLRKNLPLGFKNKVEIPAKIQNSPITGYIISEGFIEGQIQVMFRTHYYGDITTEFNILSAAEFLETDPFL